MNDERLDMVLLKTSSYEFSGSDDDMKAIDMVREALKKDHEKELRAYRDDDFMLHRFLLASGRNVEKAVKMYVKAVKWRKSSYIEELASIPPPRLPELCDICLPEHLMGTDKGGRPVYLTRISEQQLAEAFKRFTTEEIRMSHVLNMELKERKLRELTLNTGNWVDSVIRIVDLKGVNPMQSNDFIKLWKLTGDLDRDYYPEIYHRVLIINTPYIYKASLISLVGEHAKRLSRQKKVMVLGKEYTESLRSLIDDAQLFDVYGGAKKVVFPNTKFDWKLNDARVEKENDARFSKITQKIDIKNGFKFTKNVRVIRGMLLEWRFRSVTKPVLFTCRLETDDEKKQRIEAATTRSQSLSQGNLLSISIESGSNAEEKASPRSKSNPTSPAPLCLSSISKTLNGTFPEEKRTNIGESEKADEKSTSIGESEKASDTSGPGKEPQESKISDNTTLDLFSKPFWTTSHKGWIYGSAMVYCNSVAKPVVRYVMGRKKEEPVSFGVGIKILTIPPSDGKLGSLVVHKIDEKGKDM
ncbi:hypothetical protein AAMO2058_001353300 [Amorphochlora amoebiformis]